MTFLVCNSTQKRQYCCKRICAVLKGKFAAYFGRKIQQRVRFQEAFPPDLSWTPVNYTLTHAQRVQVQTCAGLN